MMNALKAEFSFIPDPESEDGIKIFNGIKQDKLKVDSKAVFGSWLLSHLVRCLRVDSCSLTKNDCTIDAIRKIKGGKLRNFCFVAKNHGLASDIAIKLISKSEYLEMEINDTVEGIIIHCLSMLKDDGVLTCLYDMALEGKLAEDDKANIKDELKNVLSTTLLSMRDQIQCEVDIYNEFVKIWDICIRRLSQIFDTFETHSSRSVDSNKSFVWHMICAVRNVYHVTEEDDEASTKRRKMIISIGACIAFLVGVIESSGSDLSPSNGPLKRARIDNPPKETELVHAKFKYRRDRREIRRKILFDIDQRSRAGAEAGSSNNYIPSVASKEDYSQSDQTALGTVTWAANASVPHYDISSDEIEAETYKVANFAMHEAQLAKYSISAFNTVAGRGKLQYLFTKLAGKASCRDGTELGLSHWVKATELNDRICSFLANPHRHNKWQNPNDFALFTAKSLLKSDQNELWLELNDWIHTIWAISSQEIKPSQNLLGLLEMSADRVPSNKCSTVSSLEKVIIPLLNDCLGRIVKQTNKPDSMKIADISIGAQGGLKCNHGSVSDSHFTTESVARCFTALYYHALESILYDEFIRLRSPLNKNMVTNINFHKGIMSASYLCLEKAMITCKHLSHHHEWDHDVAFDISHGNSYDFLKVCECFIRSMSKNSPSILQNVKLPNILVTALRDFEKKMLQMQVWNSKDVNSNPSKIVMVVDEIKLRGLWPPSILRDYNCKEEDSENSNFALPYLDEVVNIAKEKKFLNYCMTKILMDTGQTATALCAQLSIDNQVSSRIASIFCHLLRHEIEIFYDCHTHTIILCIIYALCKMHSSSSEMKFIDILKGYEVIFGEHRSHSITKSIVREGNGMHNIVDFYNKVFVVKALNALNAPGTFPDSFIGTNFRVDIKNKRCNMKTNGSIRNLFTFGSAEKKVAWSKKKNSACREKEK